MASGIGNCYIGNCYTCDYRSIVELGHIRLARRILLVCVATWRSGFLLDGGRNMVVQQASRILFSTLTVILLTIGSARADKIENGVAVFAALDKVTARISKLEVPIDSTVEFGSLKVTPRACFSRAPTEPPRTSAFVEVDEIQLEKSDQRLFTGWMSAESPGMNGVEHPVFDVWLTGCGKPERQISERGRARGAGQGGEDGGEETVRSRRRVRR